MAKKKQYHGIKFPFRNEDREHYFVDLDKDDVGYVRSQVYHVIFTPKGQRIRRPDFGTNLREYVFNPNDNVSWDSVKEDVSETVARYVRGVTIENIDVYKDDEEGSGREMYVKINFSVKKGFYTYNDTITAKL